MKNKWAVLFLLCLGLSSLSASDGPVWKVRGSNPLTNHQLGRQLGLFFAEEERDAFEAYEIEDAALVLISHLQGKGFLDAQVEGLIYTEESEVPVSYEWDKDLDTFLPDDIAARRVEFLMKPGVRFFYEDVELAGSSVLDQQEVEAFFFEEPLLFQGKRSRVFSEGGLKAGVRNLQGYLQGQGYLNARVKATTVERDSDSGAVRVELELSEGPMFTVASVDISGVPASVDESVLEDPVGEPMSRMLLQNLAAEVRKMMYQQGYPDVEVHRFWEEISGTSDAVDVRLRLEVVPGEQQRIAEVEIRGLDHTREGWLRQRMKLSEGELFDPLKVDYVRQRMSARGIFDSVEVSTEIVSSEDRKLVFDVRERFPWTWDAYMGWGSYERLRGGMSLEKINLFGLGHRLKFKGQVSMKSALAEMRYQIPEFLGTSTSVSTNSFAMMREELSFDREEYGVDFTVSKHLSDLDLNVDAVFTYQSLNALNSKLQDANTPDESVRVGSLEVRLGRDHRDSILNPTDGYRFFARVESASEWLGGQADYVRGEFGLSLHGKLGHGLIWHAAMSHGVVGTVDAAEGEIPTNKHFFPGGENSVRGYLKGGAAPKSEDGEFLGANSYLLLNLELEQLLSENLSVVVFFDGVGVSPDTAHYPFDETLGSVGLGLRYKTFMGPLRLEYGHNLRGRPGDPDGTLHLSLGFPF